LCEGAFVIHATTVRLLRRDPLAAARQRGLTLNEPAVLAFDVRAITPARDLLPPWIPPVGGTLVVTPRHLVRVHPSGDCIWTLDSVGPALATGPASLLLSLDGAVLQLLLMRGRDVAPLQAVLRAAHQGYQEGLRAGRYAGRQ
jgi:hypothetical protein